MNPRNKKVPAVKVGNTYLGGDYPVVLQAMTDTPTQDIEATVAQILQLYYAGAQIVRLTVNNDEAAQAIPYICEKVKIAAPVPLVGDFHFNGHTLLHKYPDCAEALDKYRINPGNTKKRAFVEMIEAALRHQKPVRIGVNFGSVDQDILKKLEARNGKLKTPRSNTEIRQEAVVQSALQSAKAAERLGMTKNDLVLSAKMSEPQSTISVYERIAESSDYVLHLGLTEAGVGDFGVVSSSIVLGTLLEKGIGNTLRVSITPKPSEPRTKEVEIGKMILQSLGLKKYRPKVISCPGCGRTSSQEFKHLAEEVNSFIEQQLPNWEKEIPEIGKLTVAVMGCVVNGPGESQSAHIGISLPGILEQPIAQVYKGGVHYKDLKGEDINEQFIALLSQFVEKEF